MSEPTVTSEDVAAREIHRLLDGPRPPVSALAPLIGFAAYIRKNGEAERFTPAQARYSRTQRERKARQRAIFLGLCLTDE